MDTVLVQNLISNCHLQNSYVYWGGGHISYRNRYRYAMVMQWIHIHTLSEIKNKQKNFWYVTPWFVIPPSPSIPPTPDFSCCCPNGCTRDAHVSPPSSLRECCSPPPTGCRLYNFSAVSHEDSAKLHKLHVFFTQCNGHLLYAPQGSQGAQGEPLVSLSAMSLPSFTYLPMLSPQAPNSSNGYHGRPSLPLDVMSINNSGRILHSQNRDVWLIHWLVFCT